ncbi:cytochrome c oxidase accessory protein CcoG [Rhodothalassium salexigens]|uniref:cytochrome c oxidase accessory protein CcoG n=1 Tax=Rhodothalassium salexigens TaxID=1086 RepID=UPI0031FE6D9E|nr:cytochrome c oxidase accessory protein CcoG [Rhodothalassium salexigens]
MATSAPDTVADGKAHGLKALSETVAADTDALADDRAEAVNAKHNRPLYESPPKIHPKQAKGRFRRIKWIVLFVTLGIYYLAPWVRWPRGEGIPDQAILVDFSERKFYFFFIEIWPQEFYYITGLLILAALGLFLVTSVFGRVWCGYTCPQTVWTDLFVQIERWIEGDRNKRIRLDQARWTLAKLAKRTAKHGLWLVVAVSTGGAWVFYFNDAPQLLGDLFAGTAPTPAYVSMGVLTATTYLLGGHAREQVCTYMCPWPRIQGAMFDENTLLVSYRWDRGEPRGRHKKGDSWEGRGDCIDCNQCVAVCPVGIDIRDGAQMECIQCALCIDACNDVMAKVGRPPNLIAYETINAPERRAQGDHSGIRLLRPRTLLYSALIAVVAGIMVAGLSTRATTDVNVLRDRNPVFVRLADGGIRNGYELKVLNKLHQERTFTIAVDGLPGVRLFNPVTREEGTVALTVPADSVGSVKLYVSLPKGHVTDGTLEDGSAAVDFVIRHDATDTRVVETMPFRGPN